MARGWHYAKLSLSNAPRLSFSGLCILLFLFLFLCRFLCVCVFLLLSLELGRCSSDLFLSSRPRTGLATTYIITGYTSRNRWALAGGNRGGNSLLRMNTVFC